MQEPAPRSDRRQKLSWRMADEEEQSVGRWLLEHLQESVRTLPVHLVHAVDHDDAPGRQRRGHAHELAERAHLPDRDVAGEALALLLLEPFEPAHIWVAS